VTREERQYRRFARSNGRDAVKAIAEMERHSRGLARMRSPEVRETLGIGDEIAEKMAAHHERSIDLNEAWAVASATRAASYVNLSIEARS
jgi:hypothetical protein